jgi:hypothetical protein
LATNPSVALPQKKKQEKRKHPSHARGGKSKGSRYHLNQIGSTGCLYTLVFLQRVGQCGACTPLLCFFAGFGQLLKSNYNIVGNRLTYCIFLLIIKLS